MSQILIQKTAVRICVGILRTQSAPAILQVQNKKYSKKVNNVANIKEADIKKSVFISQSTDIFTNLAMEDWIYRNFDFSDHHVLMLWCNDPCVVVGRHQNPWHEANVSGMLDQGIELARRNSGGGTVYHDRGNLNMTFFAPRERYNRKYNLNLLTRALFREWGLKTEVSPREDLVMAGNLKQISGTAAKLGQPNSYHHCTLLVNVNKLDLSQALHKHESGITTTATQSVKTPVTNLVEHNQNVSVDRLVTAVGYEYLRTAANTLEDGGRDLINKQRGFQLINPTEDWFPGLDAIRNEYSSWEWRFGRTPKFTISRSFSVPSGLLSPSVFTQNAGTPDAELNSQELKITMAVEKGIIEDVTVNIPPGMSATGYHGEAGVVTTLKGKRFTEKAMESVEDALRGSGDSDKLGEKDMFLASCFKKVVNNA